MDASVASTSTLPAAPRKPVPQPRSRLKAFWLLLVEYFQFLRTALAQLQVNGFRNDVRAFTDLNQLGSYAIGIAAVFVLSLVGIILANAFTPLWFSNFAGLMANLTLVKTGNKVGDAFVTVTVLVLGIVGPLGFLGLLLGLVIFKIHKGRSSGT